ncbi:DUF2254 domain-containing protein [Aquipuribacter nitratireducens]|uniref:DUF2254 domain-containing protein n=1 Tax=Aquipuribacter nitratireducens TaxID=650104 RepID=A0ABW0GNH2_9MICO
MVAVVQRVRESFWAVPTLLCVAAAVLALVLVEVDRALLGVQVLEGVDVLYRVGADGSRSLLSAIAGSVLAAASTTFSITIAVLALTSSAFGPRLVRNFMADRVNQAALGTFLATFLYSLLVLRAIRTISGTETDEAFVPHIAVNVAMLLAIVSIATLVWFIHHISDSIQVWTLARRVRGELRRTIDDLYPDRRGTGEERAEPELADPGPVTLRVRSDDAGYVLTVALDDLVHHAEEHDVLVRLRVRPGDFVVEGQELAHVHGTVRDAEDLVGCVRPAVVLAPSRNPAQDVGFAVQLLLDMLARALSPGTNDPYTARTALDDLSDGLAAMARRSRPPERHTDDDGTVRVVAPTIRLPELLETVVDTVRAYGLPHPDVVVRTVRLIGQVADDADRADLPALGAQLDVLLDHHARTQPYPRDRERVLAAAEEARASLPATPAL